MAFCPNCGSQLPDNCNHCPNCGAPVTPRPANQPGQFNQQDPFTTQNSYNQQDPFSQNSQSQYGQFNQTYNAPQPVPPVPTGGLMAWAIITLLLCTIPGIVAIYNVAGINKAATIEEQQKKVKNAKTWCTVGTIIGVLAIIGQFAANAAMLI